MIALWQKLNFSFININFMLTLFTILSFYKKVLQKLLGNYRAYSKFGLPQILKKTSGPVLKKRGKTLLVLVQKEKGMHYSVWTPCHESMPDLQQYTVLQVSNRSPSKFYCSWTLDSRINLVIHFFCIFYMSYFFIENQFRNVFLV